ncbi:MAG: sulfite reductase subunit alpha [Planctomycetota bacterium]
MTTSFIPESAPFNEEQRAWLNGFFAGMIGLQSGVDPAVAAGLAGVTPGTLPTPQAEVEEEDFPWHDAALPIVDRLEMADGKPLNRKLMAAMAQLDCGTCGYVCQTYAEAIASGEESSLTLCTPGGKETSKAIKRLIKESDEPTGEKSAGATNGTANGQSTDNDSGTYSRKNPYSAKLVESRPLNGDGSAKDTRHVVIDLDDSGIQYGVGDALGVYPSNCEELTAEIIRAIGADPKLAIETPQGPKSLHAALSENYCLKEPSDELLELAISRVSDKAVLSQLQQMLEDGTDEGVDILDVLQLAGEIRVSATEFVDTLAPITPRLYSIASSQRKAGKEVHLTVGKVAYDRGGRQRKGVASTMLADRLSAGGAVSVFVHPNHGGFTVPSDPDKPMIMVGPGTGIAPFLAFLQERQATAAKGKNWLFFGDQHRSTDFLYESELQHYSDSGLLTRLDTAFSRDGENKVYVQDRMREHASELWRWIDAGAHFYVCGDASRMAKDVDRMLKTIIAEQSSVSAEEAAAYVASLAKQQRYVRDVY